MPITSRLNSGSGSGVGGSSGSTDNALIRADGTGGSTVQGSLVIVSDAGDMTSPGGLCFGDSAFIGVSGGMARLNDLSHTVTDFSAAPSWRQTANRFILNSSVNTTATANTLLNQISTDPASTTNFGTMVCGSFVAQHLGSGNVTTISGFGITATNGNSGTVTTNSAMTVNSYNASTGTITTNNGLVLQTGSFSASGTVGTNKALVIKTPYTTGTLTTHYGAYIEDQSAGGTGYAIYSAGGRSFHSGYFGFGTSTPDAAVTVAGLTHFISSTETVVDFGQQLVGYAGIQWIPTSGLIFKHNATGSSGDRAILTATGSLGVGTTSPAYKLDVSGNFRCTTDANLNQNAIIGGYTSFTSSSENVVAFGQQLVGTTGIQWVPDTGLEFKYNATGLGGRLNVMLANGDFGLGLSPSYKLDVSKEMRILTTSTTGSTIHLENSNTGGSLWRIISTGSADVAGAGAFQISSFTDATTPFVILPTTNYFGFKNTAPAYDFDFTGNTRFNGNMGFFNVTPASQQTSGANLTNNVTSGGTDNTIADFSDLTTYSNDAATIRNDIYQLARKLKQVNDALRVYGLLT